MKYLYIHFLVHTVIWISKFEIKRMNFLVSVSSCRFCVFVDTFSFIWFKIYNQMYFVLNSITHETKLLENVGLRFGLSPTLNFQSMQTGA